MSSRTALLILSPSRLARTARTLVLWRRLTRSLRARAIWNKYFDPSEYLRMYPDVAQAGVSPLFHFLLRGNDEYRNPSSGFDTRYYLGRYPDVQAAGINALLHYALFGNPENRSLDRVRTLRPSSTGAARYIDNDWRRGCPLVSIVIPCFNYGRFVEQAIRSALNQTFPDIEVIVVEGGSTDASTVAEVRRIESLGLPRTQFHYRSGRHFAGDNRNFGIALARGRYVCCLDADDLLDPIYIEVAVFLAEVFGYDLVHPSAQCFGESDVRWLAADASFPQILTENRVSTVALFRRGAWAHVGGIRDWGIGSEHVCEDWDFWIRLLGHGFRAMSIREPLMFYRVHGNSITSTSKPVFDEQRERLREANSRLIAAFEPSRDVALCVQNPYVNLEPLEDPRESFLLALPWVTVGGAETLFQILGESIVASGRRLIVITSLTLPESMPHNDSCFKSITSHVYHLSRLFQDDDRAGDFVRYLIRRYRVRTAMIAGCEFLYHQLPDLAREFPDLVVVDQIFNDTGHVFNNRRYSAHIDATVVPSEQIRMTLVGSHGADPASIHVIPHGIRIPTGAPDDANGGLPEASRGSIVIGFFGRLSAEKGPDLFVEIARKLARETGLFFVMTGQGPEREKVMSRICKHGLEDKFYAPGFVPDVHPLMRAADVVVLPSRVDGMPLAVLEAQALGKPVVASRVGSLPAMIADQETGFLCEPEDVATFCARILLLARDRSLRERMGAAARESVARGYSAERMLDAYERVFRAARTGEDNINNGWRRDCPLVSIVIPCFNYGRFVEQAIRSALNQTFPDIEVIVVEGGSTDASTVAEVRRIESLGLPRTQFHYRTGQHLAGDNRNFGIALARGRYVCCLDADDLLDPIYIEVAVFLAEVFGYDLVHPSAQCFGDSDLRWLVTDASFPQILSENRVSTVALFRRGAWAHVGGIRDWGAGSEYIYEDWDFWIRLLGHGFRARSIREPLMFYRVHESGIVSTNRPILDEQREQLREANARLITAFRGNQDASLRVLDPYVNLEPLDDAREGFLVALPFVGVDDAGKLLRTIGESIVARGRRLIVITSLTSPESMPQASQVYHLARLFQQDAERIEFVRYLIRRYRVRTAMIAGCEFLSRQLPDLVREFPDLVVVDQILNDAAQAGLNW